VLELVGGTVETCWTVDTVTLVGGSIVCESIACYFSSSILLLNSRVDMVNLVVSCMSCSERAVIVGAM
jgi:hypothetical protein